MNSFVDTNECQLLYVMLSAIWYHLYILKNVNNAHGGVSLLVKLVTLVHGCFFTFLNCTDGMKSRNAPHIRFASIITTHGMLTVTCNFFFHLHYSRAMPRNDEIYVRLC